MAYELGQLLEAMVAAGPPLAIETATAIARTTFGVAGRIDRLTGERDENFRISTAEGDSFVLKISHPAEDEATLSLMTAALLHMEATAPDIVCPRVHRALNGQTLVHFSDDNGQARTVRLLGWVPGRPLRDADRSSLQRRGCAQLAAAMATGLRGFRHPAAARPLIWDLANFDVVTTLLKDLPDLPARGFISDFASAYRAEVGYRLSDFRQQVVHNDLNANNVMVDEADNATVIGVIDFGDMVETALIADVAIAASAQVTDPSTALSDVTEFTLAYHRANPLLPDEAAALNWLIAARLVTDAVIPSWHRAHNPDEVHYARVDATYIERRVAIVEQLMHARIVIPF
ncbi:phosphotransferase [Sphingomonas sp. SRS2]|uniref:phosphotransferase n=1 Tax=Sphingomonas sp. SRS2 TaxID=133190 RepID=UPI000698B2B6|nr:phosphotransferase [Sphingomonas sp. SRS2]